MIAQQRLRLIQQLSFVFAAGTLITPPQLLQDLVPCRPTYHFIHSRHGNSHFWRNVSFFPSLHPLPGNKTFGAIRLLNDRKSVLAIRLCVAMLTSSLSPEGGGPIPH